MPRTARIDAPGALHHIIAKGKHRHVVKARSLLCYWAVYELHMSMSELAGRFQISATAISKSVLRGKTLAKKHGFELE
jgi:putative transposase